MTFGMIVIYPNLIAPLFNKFQVLRDRELRNKIGALVRPSIYNVIGSDWQLDTEQALVWMGG